MYTVPEPTQDVFDECKGSATDNIPLVNVKPRRLSDIKPTRKRSGLDDVDFVHHTKFLDGPEERPMHDPSIFYVKSERASTYNATISSNQDLESRTINGSKPVTPDNCGVQHGTDNMDGRYTVVVDDGDACCGCCGTSGTSQVDPEIVINMSPRCTFWPYSDTLHHNNRTYSSVLGEQLNRINSKEKFRDELHMCARLDYPERLKVLVPMIQENFGDPAGNTACVLIEESLCGLIYKETALNLAIMVRAEKAADVLIDLGGRDLVMCPYKGKEFGGTTALHMAVVRNYPELVKKLIGTLKDPADKQTLLHAHATGTFFKEQYEISELALHQAVWTGNKDMFELLISLGASLDESDDDNNNNIIHSLVRYSLLNPDLACEMFEYIMKSKAAACWWSAKHNISKEQMKEQKSVWQYELLISPNKQGMTPLILAADIGASEIFERIINTEEVYKFPIWEYGPVKSAYYDLTEIDPLVAGLNKVNALEMLTYVSRDDALSMLNITPIRQLTQLKYNAYKLHYYGWLILHLVIMITFTLTVNNRPMKTVSRNGTDNTTSQYLVKLTWEESVNGGHIWQLAGTIAIAVYAFLMLIIELTDDAVCLWFARKTFHRLYKSRDSISLEVSLRYSSYRIVGLIFAISTFTWMFMDFHNLENADICVCFALISGWLFILFFMWGVRSMGYLTIMISRIILGDMVRFCLIFSIMIVAFTISFVALYQESPTGLPDEFLHFGKGLITIFRLMVGLTEMDILEQARSPAMATFLFIMYVLLMNMLLLNMLIAAMSDTYANLNQKRDQLWIRLRTSAMLLIERRFFCRCFRGRSSFVRKTVFINGKNKTRWFLRTEDLVYKNDPLATLVESLPKE